MGDTYVVGEKKLKYEGYFVIGELYYVIEQAMKRIGYGSTRDKSHDVRVFKTHRKIKVELIGEYAVSDYLKNELKVKLEFSDVKDIDLATKDIHKKVQEGSISIKVEGAISTNAQKQWSESGYFYLIRVMIDKLIYKKYLLDLQSEVKSHMDVVMQEISAFLNTQKYMYESAKKTIKPA